MNSLTGEILLTSPSIREMTNSEIESQLRSSLRLYTALWYATQTDQSLNLTFTTVLMQLLPTLKFIEDLKRIAVLGR